MQTDLHSYTPIPTKEELHTLVSDLSKEQIDVIDAQDPALIADVRRSIQQCSGDQLIRVRSIIDEARCGNASTSIAEDMRADLRGSSAISISQPVIN